MLLPGQVLFMASLAGLQILRFSAGTLLRREHTIENRTHRLLCTVGMRLGTGDAEQKTNGSDTHARPVKYRYHRNTMNKN
jgi:hypothetical protein